MIDLISDLNNYAWPAN